MVVFPNAKINLGLNIIEKRPDGYHNIESCFYPIPYTDALEVIENNKFSFTSSGIEIPGNPTDNLCIKAYHLMSQRHKLPPVKIHLHKNIPIGSGLGGGSSDGAFMLKLLNEKFEIGLSADNLEELAAQLGSDCSFFIRNKPVYVEGTGNIFTDIQFSLKGYHLVLVMPNIQVSTASAYSGVVPEEAISNLKVELETLPLERLIDFVRNDFENSVFNQHQELEGIKTKLMNSGALYASMSGSGSSIFGIFREEPTIQIDHDYKVFRLS